MINILKLYEELDIYYLINIKEVWINERTKNNKTRIIKKYDI